MKKDRKDNPMSLVLKNVSKTFDDTNQATLKNVDLEIKQGEFLCVVGRSGCGKSTLLNLIAGLEKPTSGEILLNGKPVTGPGADRTVMFQEHALFPWLNVIQNVKFGMEMTGVPKEEQERRADKYLEMMQLNDYREYAIHQLSGGMRQRVALARAFTMDSEILLMDEPFSALDEFTKEKLHEDLLRIWRQTNKTVVFVTHNIQEAVFLSDRICVLSPHPGRLSAIVDVDLPRPRTLEMKESPHFNELVYEVRGKFEGGSV